MKTSLEKCTLILLFNHTLTVAQEQDARQTLEVTSIIAPPPDIQKLWSQVPPETDRLDESLAPVFSWLADTAAPGDFVLIQGEFGATWSAVQEAIRLGLVPIYSTTRRQAVEEHLPSGDVEVRHIFSHVRFRRYEQ